MGTQAVLLVEGKDDLHVICNLLKHYNVPQTFGVLEKGGFDSIIGLLPVQLKASGIECLGIVVDADSDLPARWRKLGSILRKAGYASIPPEPATNGAIFSAPDLPRVGAWVMPDNEIRGMLEDFVALLVPEGDCLLSLANKALDSIPSDERRFIVAHRPKALIHTWLAWQEQPGLPMGLAITTKYLDASSPHAVRFIEWIKRLFC